MGEREIKKSHGEADSIIMFPLWQRTSSDSSDNFVFYWLLNLPMQSALVLFSNKSIPFATQIASDMSQISGNNLTVKSHLTLRWLKYFMFNIGRQRLNITIIVIAKTLLRRKNIHCWKMDLITRFWYQERLARHT